MKKNFEQRIERLRKKIKEHNLDGYLVMHAPNRFYLTGFELNDPQCNESAGCVVVTLKDAWLCTDSRYTESAKKVFPEDKIFLYRQRLKELPEFLKGLEIKKMGFESNVLTYEAYNALKTKVNLIPFNKGLVEELRIIKDQEELKAIKRACKLNHACFQNIKQLDLSNFKEMDLAWEIEVFFKNNGADSIAFSTIVASGSNSALPHHISSKEKIKRNNILLVDMGCRADNYCCDHTRTFWVGDKEIDRFRKVLNLVKEAQNIAINNIRAGVPAKDLYKDVVKFFEKHGVHQNFVHSLGHGVGLEVHESPSLGPRSEEVLKENMVITVEPGLYFPEWGGVRWEDMVIVKKDGCEKI